MEGSNLLQHRGLVLARGHPHREVFDHVTGLREKDLHFSRWRMELVHSFIGDVVAF